MQSSTTDTPEIGEGLATFKSVDELRLYVKRMSDKYAERVDKYGEVAGELMREILKRDSSRKQTKSRQPELWHRLGNVLIDTSDSLLGRNEVTLQLLQESKFKLSGCLDALRAFEEFEQFEIKPGSLIMMYIKDGIPERVIVQSSASGAANKEPESQPEGREKEASEEKWEVKEKKKGWPFRR